MKMGRILLMLLFIAALALIVATPQLRPDQVLVVSTVEEPPPLEEPVLPVEPSVAAPPQPIETSVAVVELKRLVQPLEERGDSMLFESEELFGMPFDLAITMPFD